MIYKDYIDNAIKTKKRELLFRVDLSVDLSATISYLLEKQYEINSLRIVGSNETTLPEDLVSLESLSITSASLEEISENIIKLKSLTTLDL